MLEKYVETRETRCNCAIELISIRRTVAKQPLELSLYKVVLFKPVSLKSHKPQGNEDIVSHALRGNLLHGVCVGGENANPSLES